MIQDISHACADALAQMSVTRMNYWAEFGVDTLLVILLMLEGWRRHTGNFLTVILAIFCGLLVFSFVEYCFHRWLFHTRIPLFSEGHRLHHENPAGYNSLPFFLPPLIALGLTGLCMLVMPDSFALLLMGSVAFGYLVYGLGHFIIHHVRFRQPLLRRWAARHHIHHCHINTNFGVTTPLWDILFGTRYSQHPGKTRTLPQ